MNVSGASPLANVSMTDLSSHIETSRVLAGKVWDAYVAPSHYRLLQTAGYPSPVPEIVTLLVILATFILTRRLFGRSRGPKGREGDCLMRYVQSRKALQLTQPTPQGKGAPGGAGAEQIQSIMQQVNYLVQMASHGNDVLQSLIADTQNQFNSLESGVSQLKAERDEADYELLTSSQQMIEHLAAKKLPHLDEETRARLPPLNDESLEDFSRRSIGGPPSPFIKLQEAPTASADLTVSDNDGDVADVSSSEYAGEPRESAGSVAAATAGSTTVMSDQSSYAPPKEEFPPNTVTAPQNSPPAAEQDLSRVPLGYSTDSGMASSNEASDPQRSTRANTNKTMAHSQVVGSPIPSPVSSQVHTADSYDKLTASTEMHTAEGGLEASSAEGREVVNDTGPVVPPRPTARSSDMSSIASPRPDQTAHPAFGHPGRARRALPPRIQKRAKPKQILGTTDPFATPMHHAGVTSPSAASSARQAPVTGAGLTTGAGAHTYLTGFPTQ
ncbi:hypothetical protein Pmar_PMAR021105 [Perkinsus marinus ATCC 50983]|uniref:Uncharacterized protein n=1 Tax=Perkinsus marinus (strain ATCC 50983 / TXsc) TaxID=423536 RepID=C5KGF0_PERM5|nr:hypothetical protein Pmar_PMAR021105 [Perkinsus marinus ATCC 50983]EER16506.1 hypothetical protein Pmar_PMAR021105 [Perkinsus marinus ATCC 50983]|eukprot:XP_002784710.1 hypothetical protein Pmar_PMAR021105 [Perkinsus marinus ATCC 50983]